LAAKSAAYALIVLIARAETAKIIFLMFEFPI